MGFIFNCILGGEQMKIGGLVGIVILISVIFLTVGLLIDDFETNYVDTNISSTSPINQSLRDDLVSETQINDTFKPLMEDFDDLKTQEGWFDAVQDAGIVLPKAFINFIGATFKMIGLSQQQTVAILKFIEIPILIISFVFIGLIVWFFFKMMEQVRRYPT